MSNILPKDIMDCMKDCILSLFWAKKDIMDFFRRAGCTSKDLISKEEMAELRRAEIVNRVFSNLECRPDAGLGQFRCMIKNLTEWNYFNPYYFKEIKQLDEETARRNIEHLKQLQELRDSKIKNERKRKEACTDLRNEKTLDEIKLLFLNLFNCKDENGNEINKQKRGYLFEELLKDIFVREKIEVTEPFKIQGEQIDGAFKYDGEHYIIEAKWQDTWVASNSLYQFAMKVEGKMYGRGIFFSINGYSPDSVQALQNGKALKTILVDGADLVLITEGIYTLKEMLDCKIKAAQTKGEIYVNGNNSISKIK